MHHCLDISAGITGTSLDTEMFPTRFLFHWVVSRPLFIAHPVQIPRLTPFHINYPTKVSGTSTMLQTHGPLSTSQCMSLYNLRSVGTHSARRLSPKLLLHRVCSLLQDKAGLPLRSCATVCFFCAKAPHAAVPRTNTCNGMIITVRYSAVLLSLHNMFQCGWTFMSMEDHWHDQLCREESVFEALTP